MFSIFFFVAEHKQLCLNSLKLRKLLHEKSFPKSPNAQCSICLMFSNILKHLVELEPYSPVKQLLKMFAVLN